MTITGSQWDDMFTKLMFPTQHSRKFVDRSGSYPPYNIVRRSDTLTELQIAVAGFSEDDIIVTVEDGYLKVTASKDEEETDYIYKGIATRKFEKSFALSKESVVEGASYENGILTISVVYETPEEKKPKQIEIRRSSKQLLAE